MRDHLYGAFIPLLWKHSAAAGMTKKAVAAKDPVILQTGAPAVPLPMDQEGFTAATLPAVQPAITQDLNKVKAVAVARGAIEWTKSATQAARRYYGEMRAAIETLGAPAEMFDAGKDPWRFGETDLYEPDALSWSGRSLEVKHTDASTVGSVDELLQEGRFQSAKRQAFNFENPLKDPSATTPPPAGGLSSAFAGHTVYVEIAGSVNPWPFTSPDAAKKAGVADVASIPDFDQTKLEELVKKRNLTPQKGGTKATVPAGQVHKIHVRWVDRGPGLPNKSLTFDVAHDFTNKAMAKPPRKRKASGGGPPPKKAKK